MQNATTRDLWGRQQTLFVKPRNVTLDRYEAFARKQGKTETLEEFLCGLTELVVKGNFKCTACNDGGLEAEIIRDLFTANMSKDEVRKDLLVETKSLEQDIRLRCQARERPRDSDTYPKTGDVWNTEWKHKQKIGTGKFCPKRKVTK